MIKIKKSIAALVLLSMMLVLFAGCGVTGSPSASEKTPEPQPTPEAEHEVGLTELWEYSIVYPSDYTNEEKEIVYFLKDIVSQITYGKTEIKTDEEKVTSKEIVFASSKRTTAFEWNLHDLEGEMDYIIAVGEREIVIGGNNYLADTKAVYDFVQNYLGYDIETHKMSTPEKALKGVSLVTYSRNNFNITAVNNQSAPIESFTQLRTMKDMGFDSVLIDISLYSDEQLRYLFEIALVLDMGIIMRGVKSTSVYRDSPMVKGHVLAEEPYGAYSFSYYSAELRTYDEAYSSLGWAPYVEMMGQLDAIEMFTENGEYFDKLRDLIFIWKPSGLNSDQDYLHMYELLAQNAKANGRKLAAYVESGDSSDKESSALYGWMALTGMCFGAEEVWYFNYAPPAGSEEKYITDSNYRPSGIADCIRETNAMLREFSEELSGYEYSGTMLYGKSDTGTLADPYDAGITVEGEGNLLIGCFENKTGKAYLIMDADMPDADSGTGEEIKTFVLKTNENEKQYTVEVRKGCGTVLFAD